MNCPYCSKEMEIGKIEINSSPTGFISQKFITQDQLDKTFGRKLKETIQEVTTGISMNESFNLKNSKKAYYCESCTIVLAEFNR